MQILWTILMLGSLLQGATSTETSTPVNQQLTISTTIVTAEVASASIAPIRTPAPSTGNNSAEPTTSQQSSSKSTMQETSTSPRPISVYSAMSTSAQITETKDHSTTFTTSASSTSSITATTPTTITTALLTSITQSTVSETGTSTTTVSETGTSTTTVPETGTSTTTVPETGTSTTTVPETDTSTTAVHQTDTSTTAVHQTDTSTTAVHQTDTSTTAVHQTDTSTVHQTDNSTTAVHQTDTSTTAVHQTQNSTITVPANETSNIAIPENTRRTAPVNQETTSNKPHIISSTNSAKATQHTSEGQITHPHTSTTTSVSRKKVMTPENFKFTVAANKTGNERERLCALLMEFINATINCSITGQKTDGAYKYKAIQLIAVDPKEETTDSGNAMSKEKQSEELPMTTIAIAASCGALALILLAFAVYCSCHRSSYRKNQQHLTEELQTVENGYHDNPTLEVMEAQPEMQEKKLVLNGEFNDNWIVPFDNLCKDDIPDEEDTHL